MPSTETKTHGSYERSSLAGLRERIEHEVYQDVQEYLREKIGRPTCVFLRRPDNTAAICIAREGNRKFCPLCNKLSDLTGVPIVETRCFAKEKAHIQRGFQAEQDGETWTWGWHECDLGLSSLHIPIRASGGDSSNRPILAVLVVGHYLLGEDSSQINLRHRMDKVLCSASREEYFPRASEEERRRYVHLLHEAADGVEIANESLQQQLKRELHDPLSLIELISTRTLRRPDLLESEQFFQDLILEPTELNLGEENLWENIGRALKQVVEFLPFPTAVVYSSSYDDYGEMERTVLVPQSAKVAESIGMPTYEDFQWLAAEKVVRLPIADKRFEWLCPRTYFGADSAVLFAREFVGDHVTIIGFADSSPRVDSFQHAVLCEAMLNKIFPFIQSALVGIELDHLMSETGHLMGRACGRVVSGLDTVDEINIEEAINVSDPGLWRDALLAMRDGARRLELIRHNFYAFRERRHRRPRAEPGGEPRDLGDSDVYRSTGRGHPIDVEKVLKAQKRFFERAHSRTARNVDVDLVASSGGAVINGDENSLSLVFLNLFDNAMKFAYQGTFVKVRVHVKGDMCVVSFTNLGVGVAPDEVRSGRMFRRLAKSRFRDRFRRVEGLGLGLSFCRRVIEEEFGGSITLKSDAAHTPHKRKFAGDNWLTTITVRLPVVRDSDPRNKEIE